MTAILVAASGGHLAQLVELADRLEGISADRLWVTFDSAQSRSLLRGRAVEFIPEIGERDVIGVCRGALRARAILARTGVTAVVSTGSAIALSFLPYAAMRGIPAYYIESAARVDLPSLTGRLLQPVPGVNLYRQYPRSASGRWKYAGSVFDNFSAGSETRRGNLRRIVVTLGSGLHGFRRLLERLVAIVPREAEILWQTGNTNVDGLDIRTESMMTASALEQAVAQADAVICHAGCGSALLALNAGKYPVIVPRDPNHGELIDNHQVELAGFLASRDLALARQPSTITLDDIVRAAGRIVCRRTDPPRIRLAWR